MNLCYSYALSYLESILYFNVLKYNLKNKLLLLLLKNIILHINFLLAFYNFELFHLLNHLIIFNFGHQNAFLILRNRFQVSIVLQVYIRDIIAAYSYSILVPNSAIKLLCFRQFKQSRGIISMEFLVGILEIIQKGNHSLKE